MICFLLKYFITVQLLMFTFFYCLRRKRSQANDQKGHKLRAFFKFIFPHIFSACKTHRTMSQQAANIVQPHEHDVLSGRGNYVNYHTGNEFFRSLVRKHKVAYVACPKPQKGKFSKIIVDEIRARNPPGRFLKQDPKTKLWYDIGEKKSLDKTRQALREGAPVIMKELHGEDDDGSGSDGPSAPSTPQQDSVPKVRVKNELIVSTAFFDW